MFPFYPNTEPIHSIQDEDPREDKDKDPSQGLALLKGERGRTSEKKKTEQKGEKTKEIIQKRRREN